MRSPFLVYVSAAESGEGQANRRNGLTNMNADEPDDLDDDDDEDDFLDDEDDSTGDDDDGDDEEDEEDDEPETWQVTSGAGSFSIAGRDHRAPRGRVTYYHGK